MYCDRDVLLKAHGLGKEYMLYASPFKRLLQMLFMGKKSFCTRFAALSGVDIELRRGECVGVIGRNGAGKSTLLELLSGTLTPTAGEVSRFGRVSALLELGFGFNTEFTGRENIELAGLMHGLSLREIREKTDSIIAFADVGDFIDQPVKKYSSGMFVRLAFAIIAHVDADILFIDEALAVGDIFFQQKCYKYLDEKKQNSALLLVSHDLNAVATLCDRVIVLERGKAVFSGASRDAIEYYTHLLYDHPESLPQTEQLSAEWQAVEDRHKTGKSGQFTAALLSRSLLNADDTLTISARGEIWQDCPHPIVGFFFNDRFGKRIFGNCVCLDRALARGGFEFSFDVSWPDIAPGEYTLTLGVGSGTDVMDQTVYCWATDFRAVASLKPHDIVHGVFNVRMNHFSCRGNV